MTHPNLKSSITRPAFPSFVSKTLPLMESKSILTSAKALLAELPLREKKLHAFITPKDSTLEAVATSLEQCNVLASIDPSKKVLLGKTQTQIETALAAFDQVTPSNLIDNSWDILRQILLFAAQHLTQYNTTLRGNNSVSAALNFFVQFLNRGVDYCDSILPGVDVEKTFDELVETRTEITLWGELLKGYSELQRLHERLVEEKERFERAKAAVSAPSPAAGAGKEPTDWVNVDPVAKPRGWFW